MNNEENALLDLNYWDNRYQYNKLGWDIGGVSPAIKSYMEQVVNKDLRILIPGAGNSYEAELLVQLGFQNIHVLDFAPSLIAKLNNKFSPFKQVSIIQDDFFNHIGTYDLIIEQTFFCALTPNLRKAYVAKMKSILAPKGKLVGLWFDCSFSKEGPPFGGSMQAYEELFESDFTIHTFAPCYNSIPQRQGNEVFGILEKKL